MADLLTIQNGTVRLTTEEGQSQERPEGQLLDMLRAEFVPPLAGCALPDGVKFHEWRPPLLVLVHQTPPHVRQLRWIANDSPVPFGPETTYRHVRLSVPYAITFAVYQQAGEALYLTHANELYFRNEPLRSRIDRLGYPALLNVSRIVTPMRERAWICTQYLEPGLDADWTTQLQGLLEHTWNGGFNLSSENHEGESWYGASQGIHEHLHPVELWEAASVVDDAFALTIPWKEAAPNVGEVIERLLEENGRPLPIAATPGPSPKSLNLVGRFMNFILKG